MRRYDLKADDGSIATRVHVGPELGDLVRITKRLNDDQVVELALDEAEVRALSLVLTGVIQVRAEKAAASPATTKVAAGVLVTAAGVLAIAAVVATGCLQEGEASAAPFVVGYTERSAGAYFLPTDDGGVLVRGRCGLPPRERLELGPPLARCAYVPRDRDVGLNLLCGRGEARVTFEWEPHAEGGRGDAHLERPDCVGDYAVELHRDRGAE